jgi:phage FluMu protein Com
MPVRVFVRCEKCWKILQGKEEKAGVLGECPRCKNRFTVPAPLLHEKRKHQRMLVGESRFAVPNSESLPLSNGPADYRIMYTEVCPAEFVLNRSSHSPLLDLSEGGMSFLVRTDEKRRKVAPGNSLVVEIDFPILARPIFVQVEVCGVRSVDENKLLHIGVRFSMMNESLTEVIKNLIKYVILKSNAIEIEKWGSFG